MIKSPKLNLDYLTSPSQVILNHIVPYYLSLYEQLCFEGVLCGDAGQRIVHIFQLRGDYAKVKQGMYKLVLTMKQKLNKDSDLIEKDRHFLLSCSDRMRSFNVDDPYHNTSTNNAKEALDKLVQVSELQSIIHNLVDGLDKSRKYRKQLHDRHECLCYCSELPLS